MEEQKEYDYQLAVVNHYNRHSRHFPIEDCNVAECKKAVREHQRRP